MLVKICVPNILIFNNNKINTIIIRISINNFYNLIKDKFYLFYR